MSPEEDRAWPLTVSPHTPVPPPFPQALPHNPRSQTFPKAPCLPWPCSCCSWASVPFPLPGAERSLGALHPGTGRGRWTSCTALPTGRGRMQVPGPCPLHSCFRRSEGGAARLETHSIHPLPTLHFFGGTEAQRADMRGSRCYRQGPRLPHSQSCALTKPVLSPEAASGHPSSFGRPICGRPAPVTELREGLPGVRPREASPRPCQHSAGGKARVRARAGPSLEYLNICFLTEWHSWEYKPICIE